MLISKKDLLKETEISYGQLYRWKREGLIPENWFIKQSSFTGQETFFPKVKMLNRIQAIQQLKDKYSLEELARILSPEVTERLFTPSDLKIIEELNDDLMPFICTALDRENFRFIELLIMLAISNCRKEYELKINDIKNICFGIKNHLDAVKHTDYLFTLMKMDNQYYAAIQSEQSEVYIDQRLTLVCQIHLNELSAMVKLKYRKKFNFQFEADDEGPFKTFSRKAVMA